MATIFPPTKGFKIVTVASFLSQLAASGFDYIFMIVLCFIYHSTMLYI